jgi:uncharacterized NAD-dependent epimerase/dehydratase family protein
MTALITSVEALKTGLDVVTPAGTHLLVAKLPNLVGLVARHGRAADGSPNGNVIFSFHFPQVDENECRMEQLTLRDLSSLENSDFLAIIEDAPEVLSDRIN